MATIETEDDIFTTYDFGTHGEATVYTLTGFSIAYPAGFDEATDDTPEPEAFTLALFGTDDLQLSITLETDDNDTIDPDDDFSFHDVGIEQGLLFAVTFNGDVPDVTQEIDFLFANFAVTSETFDADLLVIDSDDAVDGARDMAVVYLSGDTIGTDGLPTAAEFDALVAAGELEGDVETPYPDGVVDLSLIDTVGLSTVDVVPVMPSFAEVSLCSLFGEDFDYQGHVDSVALTYVSPDWLEDWSGIPWELDGPVAEDQMLTADYKQTVKDFADHLEVLEGTHGIGLRVYDFEDMASGNFAGSASTYTPAAGDTVDNQTGDMTAGTASGTLLPDDFLKVHLFNTGDAASADPSMGDDPGVATHEGNDADRGFNMSATSHVPSGEQYLEVLAGNNTDGGVVLCFEETAYGFGFNLMGREDEKRDVYLDIHFDDGSVFRMTTETNPNNTGGAQYVSYLVDMDDPEAKGICAVVLYEPQPETEDDFSGRDIFSIDDLVVVVDDVNGTHTSDDMKSNTREVEEGDGGGCGVYEETPFTPYVEDDHGAATTFTLNGFGFDTSDTGPDDGGDDLPSEIFSAELMIYGTSDLALMHTLDPDWEMLADGSHPQEWDIDTGMMFAMTFDGEVMDFNYDIEFELVDITSPDPEFSGRLLEVDMDFGDNTGYTGIFYIDGDMIGTDGVPTVEEFSAIGAQLDEETGAGTFEYVADGTLTLADITHVTTDTTTVVPDMPDVAGGSLCSFVGSEEGYDEFFNWDALITGTPAWMLRYTSDPMEMDGSVAADVVVETQYRDAVQDFADAVDAAGMGFHLYDFEEAALGNYADGTAGYTPTAGMTVDNVSGTMGDGTATGTLMYDELAAFHLFDTGHSGGPDDPGIADHAGNDADRGFNMTVLPPDSVGENYLEILPSETSNGGLAVCFTQGVYGFGFHLMGREEEKRDVFVDIYLSDGSVYSNLTGTNALGTGGAQFYSYLLDIDETDLQICGFVLHEPIEDGDDASMRDIFSIDDLSVVHQDFDMSGADLMSVTMPADMSETPVIEGDEFSNTIYGTELTEIILGHDGNDWILPGGGNDTIDGGEGNDMLSLIELPDVPGGAGNQFRFEVDMGEGTAEGLNGNELINFTNFERLTTSIYADVVRGTDGDDEIRTKGHYDWIIATDGNDTYNGGTGRDMITFQDWPGMDAFAPEEPAPASASEVSTYFDGYPPFDIDGVTIDLVDENNNTGWAYGKTYIDVERFTGSSYADVFVGDAESNNFRGLGGNDWFIGSEGGRERYWGGNGTDTVSYVNSTAGVGASLMNGTPMDGDETGFGTAGDAKKDLYFSIENLVGSDAADSLTGSSVRNELSGLDGDDFIFGAGGNDLLRAGAGNDTVDGGSGSDTAVLDGLIEDYVLTRTASKDVTIEGFDGTGEYTNVEYFEFFDGTIDVWSLPLA